MHVNAKSERAVNFILSRNTENPIHQGAKSIGSTKMIMCADTEYLASGPKVLLFSERFCPAFCFRQVDRYGHAWLCTA